MNCRDRMEREIIEDWRFSAYAIVKYKPEYYNKEGHYTREEWGAMSDIGETIGNHLVTPEEYFNTEQQYVKAVIELMKTTNCQYLTVFFMGDTPRSRKDSLKRLTSKKNRFLIYDKPLYETYVNLKEGKRIHISKIDQVVRLNLRGYTYTVLVNWKNYLEIRFSYDYYMYCNSRLNINILRQKINKIGLNVIR